MKWRWDGIDSWGRAARRQGCDETMDIMEKMEYCTSTTDASEAKTDTSRRLFRVHAHCARERVV